MGISLWSNGDKYEGEYVNGKIHGKGKKYWDAGENKGDVYEGLWADDLREGFGIYLFSNGAKYEGMFERNLKNGKLY